MRLSCPLYYLFYLCLYIFIYFGGISDMIQHIVDNIFIGDWQDAKYHQKEFDHIFTVAKDSPFIGHHYYGLIDGPYPNNEILLSNVINHILQIRYKDYALNEKILVHCVSGISRSVAVVAGYMSIKGYCSVDDVIYHIKKIRPIASPVPELIELLYIINKRRR